jgi:hypothetical protein
VRQAVEDLLEQANPQIAEWWDAQRKAVADLVDEHWDAQRKAVADFFEQHWNAQKKAVEEAQNAIGGTFRPKP